MKLTIKQSDYKKKEIKVDLKQVLKDYANWKHPNFGIVASFISGLGEDGVVNYNTTQTDI